MRIDLSDLTRQELIRLQRHVYKTIEALTEKSRHDALIELEAHANDLGFSLKQLLKKSAAEKLNPLNVKYAHPEDPSITWSGRGRKPNWFLEALASGKTPDSLSVRNSVQF
jgi:DNA-binding protein H-NS